MSDICKRITLSTIMQKDVFDHNFLTKAPKMMILVSRSMFLMVKKHHSNSNPGNRCSTCVQWNEEALAGT